MPSTAAVAATLSKTDQGSKAPSSSGNTSSIWSRMKSSFYTSGGKAKHNEREVAQADDGKDLTDLAAEESEPQQLLADETQSLVNKSEANLAEALRRAKEEEEKWQITNLVNQTTLDSGDDNLVSEDDSLVGGTIIVPDGGELSAADKASVSPGLSFRASMADISLLEDENGINQKQTSAEKEVEEMAAAKKSSAPLPDDVGLLGSTIESLLHGERPAKADIPNRKMPADTDDAARANGVAMLEDLEDANKDDASDADNKAKDEPAPIVGLGDRPATGSDEEVFGQAFAGIGEQMFLSDATDNAPEIAPVTTAANTSKINDENAAPEPTGCSAHNAHGRSKHHLWILSFGGLCLALISVVYSHYNVEGADMVSWFRFAPCLLGCQCRLAFDCAFSLTHWAPVADLCSSHPVFFVSLQTFAKANSSNRLILDSDLGGDDDDDGNDEFLAPHKNVNVGVSHEPRGFDEFVSYTRNDEVTDGTLVTTNDDPGYDTDVGAAPELLGSYAFALVAALVSLLGSSLLCFAKKPTSNKAAQKGAQQSNTTTPSREIRRNGRVDISDRISSTPRPGLTRTPATETPRRRSRARKNHDEKDIIASTVKMEVRTRKGRWVEARRSGRILKYGSPMKATKRE